MIIRALSWVDVLGALSFIKTFSGDRARDPDDFLMIDLIGFFAPFAASFSFLSSSTACGDSHEDLN